MEQQQNQLFAMIGELTYRLQLVQMENERLVDENQRNMERYAYIQSEYNSSFNICENLRNENAELMEKIARIEGERMEICRPQSDCAITNEEMARFYEEEAMEIDDNEIEWRAVNNNGREITSSQRECEFSDITDEQMRGLYGEPQNEVDEEMTQQEMDWMYSHGFMNENENEEPYPEWA
jgi:hypothetical protein